jgi:hypothetical protein
MEQGKIVESGDTEDVVAAYLTRSLRAQAKSLRSEDLDVFRRRKMEDAPTKILGIKISHRNGDSDILPEIQLGDGFTIDIGVAVHKPMQAADLAIVLKTAHGEPVTSLLYSDRGVGFPLRPRSHVMKVTLNDLLLAPGRYLVEVAVDPMVGGYSCDVIYDHPRLSVVSDQGKVGYWPKRPWGAVSCQAVEWEISERNDITSSVAPAADSRKLYVE